MAKVIALSEPSWVSAVLMTGVVFALVVCGKISVVKAEDDQSLVPEVPQYFERNFAESPLREFQEPTAIPTPKKQLTSSPEANPSPEVTAQATASPSPAADQPISISRLSLIITGGDTNSVVSVLRAFAAVIERAPINPGFIHFIGPANQQIYESAPFQALARRQVRTTVLDAPMPQYRVKRSPTWVLETAPGATGAHGEILIEGIEDIGPALDARGIFTASAISALPVPSAPVPVVAPPPQ